MSISSWCGWLNVDRMLTCDAGHEVSNESASAGIEECAGGS